MAFEIKRPLLVNLHKYAPEFRPSFNVGATLDLPTAEFYTGRYGEYLISGGLGNMVAVAGPGNSNKSTITDWMHVVVLDRLAITAPSVYTKYDTEETATPARVVNLSKQTEYIKDIDIIDYGMFVFTNKSTEIGEVFYTKWKASLEAKIKDKHPRVVTPFIRRDGVNFDILPISQNSYDSMTDFSTSSTDDMLSKHDINDAKTNRVFLVQGRDKSTMLMEMPTYTSKYNDYLTITTHIGKKAPDIGGMAKPPSKDLTHLKADERIKGMTAKANYMFSAYWLTSTNKIYWQDGTKFERYPKRSDNIRPESKDLQTTNISLIRAKSGAGSGTNLTLVISQRDGVIPYLTELDYCKSNGDFGLIGGSTTWAVELMPDIKMTRNTARTKFDDSNKLRRAINLTSEICQLRNYFFDTFFWIPNTIGEIIDGIKTNGYDIDFMLEKTRGWWTIDNDKHPLLYLSSLDFVRLSLSKDHPSAYHPYWLDEDKKTIKKEFVI